MNYQSIGSAAGERGVNDGVVDFGATDDPADEPRASTLRVPMTIGAVVLAYNLPGGEAGGELRLSPEIVADVFLGKITQWDDARLRALNPARALPPSAITVVHRAEGSGTSAAFTAYLSRTSDPWKAAVGAGTSPRFPVGVGAKGNEGVTALVRSTPSAIGYMELAYAKQAALPMAAVRNRAGRFVAPTLKAVELAARSSQGGVLVDAEDEHAYPIAAISYVVIPRNATDRGRAEALSKFLWWALHDGQRVAPSLDYVALTPELVSRGERVLSELRAQGKPL